MIATKECFQEAINSPVRQIGARVELYSGSTLLNIFKYTDSLKSFTVERLGDEGKFFGFGVCQKINVHLIDPTRALTVSTANTLEVEYGAGYEYMYPYPAFYVSEVYRDENTNELSITAYDLLYRAAAHTAAELNLTTPYTVQDVVIACGAILGLPIKIVNIPETDTCFKTSYDEGINIDGTETIREILDRIAEATQTIYYIDYNWNLTFKRLDISGEAVTTISKDKYFTLDSKTNRRLTAVCHATELGDNVIAEDTQIGTTQYIRDNPFWDLRNDIGTLVDNALAAVNGLTFNQFDCEWRGNFAIEIGDKIELITKDNESVYSYVINDSLEYDGFFSEHTQWNYSNDEAETATNPANLGDVLKQSYARVDKANKQIDLVASETETNKQAISSLQLNTDSINASVEKVEAKLDSNIENVNESINTLTSQVSAKMSAEEVQIEVSKQLENGAGKVITSTGFTFDDTGLKVSKSGSEMETQITEDGMKVFRDNTEVLVANNVGVEARNLHANTYLIIGNNSRFEDYGRDRTGCFWIGG